ncbi:hypothetical protein PBI_SCTP2_521 [Salicola phage SCTP-2]|nr:hypothetical protein PBI_SCTP2_521 [Salicola phage SCTP-2]
MKINQMTDDEKIQYIFTHNRVSLVEYITEPSQYFQMEIVKRMPSLVIFLQDPIEEVQIYAVKENGFILEYIEEPSDNVQLEALKHKWIDKIYHHILKNCKQENKKFFNKELNKLKLLNGALREI